MGLDRILQLPKEGQPSEGSSLITKNHQQREQNKTTKPLTTATKTKYNNKHPRIEEFGRGVQFSEV